MISPLAWMSLHEAMEQWAEPACEIIKLYPLVI